MHDRGVNLKRRPPKSRPAASRSAHVSDRGRGPQGLRRPRFSFFRFTCQTAQDRPGPLSLKESRRSPRFRVHRKLVHRISVRSFAGAPSRRSRQRAVRAVYRTPLNALSTPNPAESASVSIFSTLAHTHRRPPTCFSSRAGWGLSTAGRHRFDRIGAVLRPHSSDVLDRRGAWLIRSYAMAPDNRPRGSLTGTGVAGHRAAHRGRRLRGPPVARSRPEAREDA